MREPPVHRPSELLTQPERAPESLLPEYSSSSGYGRVPAPRHFEAPCSSGKHPCLPSVSHGWWPFLFCLQEGSRFFQPLPAEAGGNGFPSVPADRKPSPPAPCSYETPGCPQTPLPDNAPVFPRIPVSASIFLLRLMKPGCWPLPAKIPAR